MRGYFLHNLYPDWSDQLIERAKKAIQCLNQLLTFDLTTQPQWDHLNALLEEFVETFLGNTWDEVLTLPTKYTIRPIDQIDKMLSTWENLHSLPQYGWNMLPKSVIKTKIQPIIQALQEVIRIIQE
jgi:hypothetical protein